MECLLFEHIMCEICRRLLLFQSKLRPLAKLICLPGLWCYLLSFPQGISINFAHFLQQLLDINSHMTWHSHLSSYLFTKPQHRPAKQQ